MKHLIYSIIVLLILLSMSRDNYYESILKEDINYAIKVYNNKDIIARLEIPGLFNTFITQTTNNNYYLNHGIDKRKDIRGIPFIDYRTNLNDSQINIYGHSTNEFILPFQSLTNFLDPNYFNKNNIIYLQTLNNLNIYNIFMIKEITTDLEHMIIDSPNIIEHINKLKENSINYRNIEYNDNSKLLILQTCSLKDNNSFYIIGAIKI